MPQEQEEEDGGEFTKSLLSARNRLKSGNTPPINRKDQGSSSPASSRPGLNKTPQPQSRSGGGGGGGLFGGGGGGGDLASSIAQARNRLRTGSSASSGSGVGSPQLPTKSEEKEPLDKPPLAGIVKPSDLRKRKEMEKQVPPKPAPSSKPKPPLPGKPVVASKPPVAPKNNRIANLMKGFEKEASPPPPSLISTRSPERKMIDPSISPQTGRRLGGHRPSVNEMTQRYARGSSESAEENSGSGTISPTQRSSRTMSPASDDERPPPPSRPGMAASSGPPSIVRRAPPPAESSSPFLPPRNKPVPPSPEPEPTPPPEQPVAPSPVKRSDSKKFIYTPFSKRSSVASDDFDDPEPSSPPPSIPPSLPGRPQQAPPPLPPSSDSNTHSTPPFLPPSLPSRPLPAQPPLPGRPPPSMPPPQRGKHYIMLSTVHSLPVSRIS